MSPIVPLGLIPGFLTASQVSAASLAEESLQLERLHGAAPRDGFDALSRLEPLYFSNRKSGGREGLAWLSKAREAFRNRILNEPEFGTIKVTLQRQGRDCPVLIERLRPEDARLILPADLYGEVKEVFERSMSQNHQRLFLLIMKTADGCVQALSVNLLVSESGTIRMSCERAVKRDRNEETEIRDVGLAFLLARLDFMKRNGLWGKGALLDNLDPRVSRTYRRRLGIEPTGPDMMGLHTDFITAREGELFLKASRLVFEPVEPVKPALSPPAPASKTVLLDGSPAG